MSRRPREQQSGQARRRAARRRRALGGVLSLAGHGLILVLLLRAPTDPPRTPEPAPMTVALVDGRRLLATAKPLAPAQPRAPTRPAPTPPSVRRIKVRRAPAPPDIEPLPEDEAPAARPGPELSEAQLAGAASAEPGPEGGACDMAGRLQAVLRKDPLVHAAVAGLAGKAVKVWDGEWVWMRGDVGQGLTAVRQAMTWEIAFAPQACRAKPMHGLVVFSLNAPQGPVRLAVGLDDWRWTDLLAPRSGGSESGWARR